MAGICLDIKNAFGTIPWPNICRAAEEVGFPEYLMIMLRSYLTERRVRLAAGDEIAWTNPSKGVPQGSILGPTLWNMIYNKILTKSYDAMGSQIISYADDTLILVVGSDPDQLVVSANEVAWKVILQIEALGLEIAPQKTETVLFTTRRSPSPPG